jgi:hypothetical protein
MAASVTGARADDDRFTFRGFGTLGATTHNAVGVEFRRNVGQGRGAEAGEIDLGVDSIAGLQADIELGPQIDVVVQGLGRLYADGKWNPTLSQGFLRYSPDDSLVLRAGRVGYDIYLLAESRQVGFSYLTVRPSPEFYGQIADDQIDGLDVSYTRRLGPGLMRARLFGGRGTGDMAFEDRSHRAARGRIHGGTLDYIHRGWTGRVALVRFEYEPGAEIPLLAGALRATGFPGALAIADDIDADSYQSLGTQVGVAYDEGPMLVQLMYGAANSDSIVGPEFDKLYALFGYRIRKWTPFVAYASSADRNPPRETGLPDLPMLAPLNAAVVDIQDRGRSTQRTASLGVRFDLSSRIDFKLQLDRTHVRDSALNFDYRLDSGSPYDMTVIAATMDFVF